MELASAIKSRRSIRRFKSSAIPRKDIEEIVNLGLYAPSPNNQRNWKIVVVQDREKLQAMASAVEARLSQEIKKRDSETMKKVVFFSTFFKDAPAVLTIWLKPYKAIIDEILVKDDLTHSDMNRMRGYPDIQSVGAMIQTLMLAAVEKGYGTCWMSGSVIAGEEIRNLLGIDRELALVAIVPIGKPDMKPAERAEVKIRDFLEFID